MTHDLDQLTDEAARLLRRIRARPVGERTPLVRELAQTIVEARSRARTPDDRVDWKGTSGPYRAWLRSVYDREHVPRDEVSSLQSTLRYHVNAVVRERLDEETLREYGLVPSTTPERDRRRRANDRTRLMALDAREHAGGVLTALTIAHAVLEKVDPAELGTLDDRGAHVAEETITDLERRVAVMRKHLRASAPGGSAAERRVTPPTALEFQAPMSRE